MAVQVTYPGVYIDEFAPGAPIQGVGTSTAAFIGVAARRADLDTPTKVTSWDQFRAAFGDQPVARLLPLVRRARLLRERRPGLLRRARQQRRLPGMTLNDRTAAPAADRRCSRARQPGEPGITVDGRRFGLLSGIGRVPAQVRHCSRLGGSRRWK